MKIAFTWDYELFFGENSGTVEKCLLEPTNKLLEIAEKTNSKFTFFVDSGMLFYGEKNPNFQSEFYEITKQISIWDNLHHETGLHIHPHWEDAKWNNGWKFSLERYKLKDFSNLDIQIIFENYYQSIQKLIKNDIISYRAGGWCIQPFENIKSSFENYKLSIESSVFFGGKNLQSPYEYNFTESPNKEKWKFENNECQEVLNGSFLEIPIGAQSYSPLFFWKLFLLGRLNPQLHKPIGDGSPAKGGGSKKDFLTRFNRLCVSADGYFVTKIENAVKEAERKNIESLVIIGHPKACTLFSLNYLEKLIFKLSTKHEIVCLNELAK